eukprot:8974626-Pyramimonas_sp.AAC.1
MVLAQARLPRVAAHHSADVIRKAVAACAGFGVSTSGVEQGFGKGDLAMGNERLPCRPGAE